MLKRISEAAGISLGILQLWQTVGPINQDNFYLLLPTITIQLAGLKQDLVHLEPLWDILRGRLAPHQLVLLWASGWPGPAPDDANELTVYERIITAVRYAQSHVDIPAGFAPHEEEIIAWLETRYWSLSEDAELLNLLQLLEQYSLLLPTQLPDTNEAITVLVLRCTLAVKAWLWSNKHIGDEFYDYHGFRRSRGQLNPAQVRKLESRVWEHEEMEFTGREPVSPRLCNTIDFDGIDVYAARLAHFHCVWSGHIVFKISNVPSVFTRPYFFEGALPEWNAAELTDTKHFVQVQVKKETLEIIGLTGLREALKPVEVGGEQMPLPPTRTNEGEASGGSSGKKYPVEAAQRSSIGQYAFTLSERVQISAGIREPELVSEPRQPRSVRDGHSARSRSSDSERKPMGMPLTNFFTVPWGADIIVMWAGLDYSGKATYFFRAPAAYQSQLLERLHYVTTNHPRLRSFLLTVNEGSSQQRQLLHRHLGFVGALRASRQANTEASVKEWQQRADLLISAGPSTTVPYKPDSTWALSGEPVTQEVALADAPIPEMPIPSEGTDWLPALVTSLQRFNESFLLDFPC